MKTQIGIHFGALAEEFALQLKKQGFKYDTAETDKFQDWESCILKLSFSGLLNDSQKSKLYARLYRKIVSHVCKVNKLKVRDTIGRG